MSTSLLALKNGRDQFNVKLEANIITTSAVEAIVERSGPLSYGASSSKEC